MKKINVLKNNRDFNRIIENSKPYRTQNFIIYLERNDSQLYNFGISVGKKIGNAVTRNYYKRIIRNIIDEKIYQNGFNCIIILKKSVLNCNYESLKINLLKSFENIKITKE